MLVSGVLLRPGRMILKDRATCNVGQSGVNFRTGLEATR
jgi:hypothetical protein